jgi:2-methylisocitrate lyase-like PEP mutase family enzyme
MRGTHKSFGRGDRSSRAAITERGPGTAAQLEALGFRIAIYPGLARYAAGFGIRHALDALRREGNTKGARDRMLSFKDYNEALKLDDIVEWEGKYLPPAG